MSLLKVRVRKTGDVRTVTKKAYSIIPHAYQVLAEVDDNGNETEVQAQQQVQKKSAQVAAAAEIPQFDSDVKEYKPNTDASSAPTPPVAAQAKPAPKKAGRPARREGSNNTAKTSENG